MRGLFFFSLLCVIFLSCKTKRIPDKGNATVVEPELNYIPYYLTMYKADSLFLMDDFKGSYRLLDSLFKIYPPLDTDNYVEYSIYLNSAVMSGHVEDIDAKVRYGYTHFGGIVTLHKNSYEMYQAVNKATNLNEADIVKLKQNYANSLNPELRARLSKMFEEDQEIRLNGGSYDDMAVIDERNQIELEDIFKEYGYPANSLIGTSSAYDMPGVRIRPVILLLHQSNEFKIKYLPILFDYVKKGKCDPETYASVYDKLMIETGKNQYFGSFRSSSGGPDDISPVSNPMKLDSIRASIGLPPIKYYPWKLRAFAHD